MTCRGRHELSPMCGCVAKRGAWVQYVGWANLTEDPDSFFWDDSARAMFRAHMQAMVNRKNSINGVSQPLPFCCSFMQSSRPAYRARVIAEIDNASRLQSRLMLYCTFFFTFAPNIAQATLLQLAPQICSVPPHHYHSQAHIKA